MTTINSTKQPQANESAQPQISLPVRTNLRAGAWNCNTCVGTVNGSTLFKPTCEYCQQI